MATTTTLTTFEPGNSTGSLQVQVSLYNSTPDSGNVEDGCGLFWVYRPGVGVIHRWTGMVGGWATRNNGDILFAQYIDGAGVAGAIVSYTFVILNTWDGQLYVDTSWGGTESGTISEPYSTYAAAYAAYLSARVADDKWQLLVKRGETFDGTGLATTSWMALSTTVAGHLEVSSYGTGAKPAITIATSGNGSVFANGPYGVQTLTLADLDVTGAGSGTGSQFCNFNTTPVSGSTEANICVLDCDVIGCDLVYVGSLSGSASSFSGDTQRIDFHAVIGCTFDDWGALNGGHGFTNLSAAAYILMMDCTWLDQIDANGFTRNNRNRYTAYINNTYDRSGSSFKLNVFRLGGGEDTAADDCCKRVCITGNRFIDCGEGIEVEPAQHPYEVSYEDVEILYNYFTQSAAVNYAIAISGVDDNSSHRITRMRIIGNQSNSDWLPLIGIVTGGAVTDTGHIESLLAANNTSVIRGSAGLGCLANVNGSSTARVDAGALRFHNNLAVATGSGGLFLSDGGGAITESKIASSNHNHFVTNGGSPDWTASTSLATWQGGGKDANSTASNSGSHNLTDVTVADFDARPASGTGPQIDTGDGTTVYVDADGNLFVDDAGAFEDGGVPPTAPTVGGPNPPIDLVLTPTSSSVGLAWSDEADDEDNYEVQYKLTSEPTTWTVYSAALDPNTTTANITGLASNTSYDFRVRATNGDGDSAWLTGTVSTLDVLPTAPSGVTVTPLSSSSLQVDWTDNSNNEVNFVVEYKLTTEPTTWTLWSSAIAANATTTTITGLSTNTAYDVRVRARNAIGDSSNATGSGTTLDVAPNAPTSATLTPTHVSVLFGWTDNSTNETAFEVDYKLTSEPTTWTTWDHALAPNTTSTTITGLTPSTSYDFRVRAVNGTGNSSYLTGTVSTTAAPAQAGAANGSMPGMSMNLELRF